MQEITNKQCPICGEYIPFDTKICPYCCEDISGQEVATKQDGQNSFENELIKDNIQNKIDSMDVDEQIGKSNYSFLKYSLIITFVIIFSIAIVFLIFYLVNRNTDVTIIPHDNNSITESKLLEGNMPENIKQAKILYKEGKIDEAAQLFQDEIDSNNNPVAYYYLGEIYRDNKFTNIAISNYKSALEHKKNFYEPLKRLAEIYVQKGENEIALDYANKAIKQNAKDLELLKAFVQIYSNMSKEEELLQTHKKIVQLDKKDYNSNFYLAYHFYNRDNYKEAIPYLKNLLDIAYNTETAYNLAISYAQIEYYTKAIEILDLIINNDPYEYYNATYAKLKLNNMKNYYNATHKQTSTKKNSRPTKQQQESFDNEAENALF